MKAELKDRLRQAMDEGRFTQKALAEKSGVSQSNIAYILSGRNKSVTASNLDKLASSLGVSIAWLSGESNASKQNWVSIPFKTFDQASGDFIDFERPPITYEKSRIEKLLEGKGTADDCFAMDVVSDNMSPLLSIGDMVTINTKDTDPTLHQQPRVFVVQSAKSVGIYRIVININQVKLESLNPIYDPVKLSGELCTSTIKVIGRVIDRQGSSGL